MATEFPEMENVVARLDRLENQNRWLKRAGAAFFILGVISLGTGARSMDDTVKAREFLLIDNDDNVRARLFTEGGGGAHLNFLDKKGTPVLLVSTGDLFQGVVCNDSKGRNRAIVVYDNRISTGVMQINDAQGGAVFSKP
jgi:hypothetical protein